MCMKLHSLSLSLSLSLCVCVCVLSVWVKCSAEMFSLHLIRYLHEVCLPSVVHRNFKSANILLDEELNPHLSDCGLAALTPNTERQVSKLRGIMLV